jgi:Domain of unknown function (DUF4276)
MRVYAVVEGSSEERFLKFVSEHLANHGIFLSPMKIKLGGGGRGGGRRWERWQRHITTLLKQQKGELKEATKHLTPEEVNDGPMTAPSKRIGACARGFRKTIHGLDGVKSIGLARLRAACPRFEGWMTQLEQLAGSNPAPPEHPLPPASPT